MHHQPARRPVVVAGHREFVGIAGLQGDLEGALAARQAEVPDAPRWGLLGKGGSFEVRRFGELESGPQRLMRLLSLDLSPRLGMAMAVASTVVTTSGRLRETHGVKAILHAAVVTGAYGRGFQAISDDLLDSGSDY